MPINKVVYDGNTLIDLTDSTLSSADQLMEGVTAYDRSGTKLMGTGKGGGGTYALSYDENSIGTALVGDAVTVEPNYIPSGDVVMDYSIEGSKLYINGFRFIGSGVKFVINSNVNSNAVGTGAADYMEI